MFRLVLDACALYPLYLRDTLLRLAERRAGHDRQRGWKRPRRQRRALPNPRLTLGPHACRTSFNAGRRGSPACCRSGQPGDAWPPTAGLHGANTVVTRGARTPEARAAAPRPAWATPARLGTSRGSVPARCRPSPDEPSRGARSEFMAAGRLAREVPHRQSQVPDRATARSADSVTEYNFNLSVRMILFC